MLRIVGCAELCQDVIGETAKIRRMAAELMSNSRAGRAPGRGD